MDAAWGQLTQMQDGHMIRPHEAQESVRTSMVRHGR